MYKYFLVLADLNLPDAPNGEVVDYTLSKGARTIVLSGNIDKEFRKKILQKNIIDYISKSGVDDINYIIATITRLQKNQNHKILVVDDSMVFRKQLKDMLENLFYKVITVAHGEEAIGMLSVTPDISLVLTDYNMPVMNGIELTNEIRQKYNKNDLSIIAISSNEDDDINALFLKLGANDYIKKPFSREEFSCRLNNSIEAQENLDLITNTTNRDSLTGLYNKRYFMNNIQNFISVADDNNEQLAIAIIDIDSFTNYSKENMHKILTTLGDILRTNTNYKDIVARIDDNEFYVLFRNSNLQKASEILNEILQEINICIIKLDDENILRFSVSIGLAVHDDDTIEETINQADSMLYNAQQNGGNQLLFD